MADISKIRIGSTDYNIKDTVARLAVTNTLHFKGVSTVAVINGGTLVPTNIYGEKATVADIAVGDMIIYGKGEYIWAMSDGTGGTSTTGHWILIDALNAYGSLASQNSASGTTSLYAAHSHTIAANTVVTNVAGASTNVSATYIPAGAVATTIAESTAAGLSVTLNGGAYGKLKTATYTPGSTNIYQITNVGSTPSLNQEEVTALASTTANVFTASVTDEVLTLTASKPETTTVKAHHTTSWSAGTVPTRAQVSVINSAPPITYATGKTVKNGETAEGTAVAITLHSGGTGASSKVTFGKISNTFTGTLATIATTITPNLTVTKNANAITTSSNGAHTHTVTVE